MHPQIRSAPRIHPSSCDYLDIILDLTPKKLKAQIIQVCTRQITSLCLTPLSQNEGLPLVPCQQATGMLNHLDIFPVLEEFTN